MSSLDVSVRLYLCAACKTKLHNYSISQINEHRKTHGLSELPQREVSTSFEPSERKKKRAARKVMERKKKKLKPAKRSGSGDDFYNTSAWLELRYKALKVYGRTCALCGSLSGPFHVDHIKPRSKYPCLALSFSNLQVLCAACNMGKSNKDETDWRNIKEVELSDKKP